MMILRVSCFIFTSANDADNDINNDSVTPQPHTRACGFDFPTSHVFSFHIYDSTHTRVNPPRILI
jgi:hypothetical protein